MSNYKFKRQKQQKLKQNDLFSKYKEIGNGATEQKKKQNYIIDLTDDVLDENNPFNVRVKTQGIFTDDDMSDDTDQNDIKKVSEDVFQNTNDQNEVLFVDLPKE